MIIFLANGKKIILDDITKDPRAEAIKWLREYKKGPGRIPGPETRFEGKGVPNVKTDYTTS